MTHRTCHEWGRVAVGEGGFTLAQSEALLAAARAHPCGGGDGSGILVDNRRHLSARQVVGVLAAGGASIEILPKVDPADPDEAAPTVRRRLLHMLDVAMGLGLAAGPSANLSLQNETLLDILIRHFAERLLSELRRGLPRRYSALEDDLQTLRGSLNVVRQFTVHALRPDRLACRFDSLESDTPLMHIMKACVVMLGVYAKGFETKRMLGELRHYLAAIPDVPQRRLPWSEVRIDRTNQRWRSLFDLAQLLLGRNWQSTQHSQAAREGIGILFPMNDLFEAYVAAKLKQVMAGSDIELVAQGGLRHCLGEWSEEQICQGNLFLTKPDLLLRRRGQVLAVIDTKWKRLGDPLDRKQGVSQSDVYQMMAYARLYRCDRLMLLYPSIPGQPSSIRGQYGLANGRERLSLGQIDVANLQGIASSIRDIVLPELGIGVVGNHHFGGRF